MRLAAFAEFGCAVLITVAVAISGGRAGSAEAAEAPVKIGVLTDLSGFAADSGGAGVVAAVKLAVKDAGGSLLGQPIELVQADTLNKPDSAAQTARRWFEAEGVDAIVGLPVTPVALAVQSVARAQKKVLLINEGASTELTGRQCSPYTVHFADDTNALAAGTARALVEEGGKSWFFVTADFAFGHTMEEAASKVVTELGGHVVGHALHPLNATDYASPLLQAQQSNADVIALANSAGDTINAIKQAAEFAVGRDGRQKLTGLLLFISDVHSLGLDVAQGLFVTTGFYWDENDEARAFAKRFAAEFEGRMPTKAQANAYAEVRHYLAAIAAAKTKAPDAVMEAMRKAPIDYFGKTASLREDGRVLYDVTLYQVKSPAESKAPWDYYKKIRSITAKDAFLPADPQACAFLRK
ncbi:MAG: ABC transporter substrate-binding protein [Hyphomicrobiales bacterium]|nr:ABC transporter substrate-binding protein [Hyphomicrobiales bacterium]